MHSNNHVDERTLVEQAKSDPLAFGWLFDNYYDPILNYILHRTANVHLAQELASNTFYKALRKLWQFKWQKIPFSAWLYRIASNEVNEFYRKHKSFHLVQIEPYVDQFDDPASAADREIHLAEQKVAKRKLFLELHEGIAQLQPRYQEVVVLKYFEGKKISEIAQVLGKSEGTIKSLLHRAHKQLQAKLHAAHLEYVQN